MALGESSIKAALQAFAVCSTIFLSFQLDLPAEASAPPTGQQNAALSE